MLNPVQFSLYDSDDNCAIDSDAWRPLNVFVHAPGSIGQIVRAKWYNYRDCTTTPCDSGYYYYFYDALGNVAGVYDENTDQFIDYEMDAFGNDLPGGNSFLAMDQPGPKEHLTGKMFDTDTGLYYFHARWYDPEVGRFVGRDPLRNRLVADAPAIALFLYFPNNNCSSYSFVGGNPVLYVDPTGEYGQAVAGFGIGCVIGAGGSAIKWWLTGEGSWRDVGCSCLGSGIAGAITSALPSVLSGCIGGAVGSVVTQWCKCGLPDSVSEMAESLVRAVMGCILGYPGGGQLVGPDATKAAVVGALASYDTDLIIEDGKMFTDYSCCE